MWLWFHKLGSPPYFYRTAGRLIPWFAIPAALLLLAGTVGGLAIAPPDYEQGDGFRIIYVHVPSAYLAMFGYVAMAVAAAIGLIWRMKLAFAFAAACAPVGAAFTFLCLATGSLWGKPMWGVWWDWDGRMTSMLVLLFLYLGVIALRGAFDDAAKGDRAAALLAIVGVVNIPIIKFSVDWWNTLHQPATISKLSAPSMTMDMLGWLLTMVVGYMLFFAAVVTLRLRGEVLLRERGARWIRGLDGRA
ncbi:MAG: cytochrome c biogenesis protein CcsA [Gammaproteobacteria bacterium]|nr:cytochrome c biogenesis protein CcsA [Gammaproteobacteria bacterium]TVQ45214.1 MAG: heme ABC transporter permease [Gammaproteobacteria bacterium]